MIIPLPYKEINILAKSRSSSQRKSAEQKLWIKKVSEESAKSVGIDQLSHKTNEQIKEYRHLFYI